MYWTLELASKLEDAPWPATKDELIDYAMRSGAPLEVIENLQEIEDEGDTYESIEDIWPDYPSKEDFLFNEDEYSAKIRRNKKIINRIDNESLFIRLIYLYVASYCLVVDGGGNSWGSIGDRGVLFFRLCRILRGGCRRCCGYVTPFGMCRAHDLSN